MRLLKAGIKCFRLLHDVEIIFDDATTSIVGKNNTGKTSLSVLFTTFLSERARFCFDDFSLKTHSDFVRLVQEYAASGDDDCDAVVEKARKELPRIQLLLSIQYEDADNWGNLRPFMTSLDEGNELSILCEFSPESTEAFLKRVTALVTDVTDARAVIKAIRSCCSNHYRVQVRPHSATEETGAVERSALLRLIRAKAIKAQRVLDDSDSDSRLRLSKVFEKQFRATTAKDESAHDDLLAAIEAAAENIDKELGAFFAPFVEHFARFGFPGMESERVQLESQLEPQVLFRNNVRLVYEHPEAVLPENYNGLGYSNLIYILSQIVAFCGETADAGGGLNLIFLEEPEAHMHPQMQSVFVKNITAFLAGMNAPAQTILTTHSAHILANARLESIRYCTREDRSRYARIKDLMGFSNNMSDEKAREFLQQYLTLGRCSLFFADKAILFEGSVERVLMPLFIQKLDADEVTLLSGQYIACVEMGGAYMSKFKDLLKFLGVRTLIITDIDAVSPQLIGEGDKQRTVYKKCPVSDDEALVTCNTTLKQWLPGETKLLDLLAAQPEAKTDDTVRVAYQLPVGEEGERKCGRSFEEAFLLENAKYICDNRAELASIATYLADLEVSSEADVVAKSYAIQDYIDRRNKKTDFAFDLLSVKCDDWRVPSYIADGLQWLAE